MEKINYKREASVLQSPSRIPRARKENQGRGWRARDAPASPQRLTTPFRYAIPLSKSSIQGAEQAIEFSEQGSTLTLISR